MSRKFTFLGASALLVVALLPASVSASAAPSAALVSAAQPKDDNRYVNLDNPASLRSVDPDVVTQGSSGQRIEIYGSVGDNEGSGSMDWRTVNAFSYLVSSVPKGSASYTTLFNSLYDLNQPKLVSGKWTVANRKEVFAPTAAYLNQANLYDTPAERVRNIHVLGAKESIDEALAAKSSLAQLVRSGYGSNNGSEAVDYRQCAGKGGCLSGTKGLMHSKYGAFEKTLDSDGNEHSNVVWITSSNLNGSSGSKKSNISIVIYDDAKAYNSVVNGIFKPSVEVAKGNKTSAQALDTPAYKDAISLSNGVVKGMSTDSGITLFPSPRRKTNAAENTASTDVEAAFLKQRAADGTDKAGCKVYAVHSLFNATRNGVKDGLGKLLGQKCDVRVVLGENAISDIVDGYFNMSTSLRELVGRVEFANVHDKTLSYKDSTTATTFGGASNFTGTSLEYDELAFRADNAGVTQAVQDHSERIYRLAKGQVSWTNPTSVSISPTSALQVRVGQTLQLSPRVKPSNALVTKTEWSVAGVGATVTADGKVTGRVPGDVKVTAKVSAPGVRDKATVTRSKTVTVKVVASGTTTTSAGGSAVVPPTLTMDNYQGPDGTTNVVVTWGSGDKNYRGVVKLQYYSGGWKTYGRSITTGNNGVGKLSANMSSSRTWRAYGARLDRINGVDVPNSTSKAKSAMSINTVRTRSATTTPRLYATSMVKSGAKIPFLVSWKRSSGKFRLQMRSAGGSWKTHSTYAIPSGASQVFFAVPALNTKYWRIATSTGSTKTSNTIKVAMK